MARVPPVVIGGWMHNPTPDGACPAVLVMRTTTVHLDAPLSGRVIIDASTGQPVKMSAAFPAPRPS
jgi:hypothetical protein